MIYVMKKDAHKIDRSKVGKFNVVDLVKKITIKDFEVELYDIDTSYTERLDLFGGAENERIVDK